MHPHILYSLSHTLRVSAFHVGLFLSINRGRVAIAISSPLLKLKLGAKWKLNSAAELVLIASLSVRLVDNIPPITRF